MVVVKVRETYDLHTVKNKMTVIGIHTPNPEILKRNFPGLLMQCKAYRPLSANVVVSCASVLPLDPRGVGTADTDVAPEDVFNPILYKAMSNKGMSQLEARINYLTSGLDVAGSSADVEVDNFTDQTNEFGVYYGLLSNAHDWKHANPQRGLEMSGLRPLVYDVLYNVGDEYSAFGVTNPQFKAPQTNAVVSSATNASGILGNAHPMPFINCTSYTYSSASTSVAESGFKLAADNVVNAEQDVPWLKCYCGCIIIPPSRLHELFYRMTIVWNIEFSSIRPLSEIVNWVDLGKFGSTTHYQNYSYESAKKAITGSDETMLDSDSCMMSANVDIDKVM